MPGLFDRIKDTWNAGAPTLLTTLSTFAVSGTAPGGYQTFSARYAVSDANIPVAIVSQTSTDWMTCWCTYTAANTLRIDTIMFSSNGDLGVTFPVGAMDIFVTPAARAIPGLREANTFTANNTFSANAGFGTAATSSRLIVKATASNVNATTWTAQDDGALASIFADSADGAWLRLWDGAGTEQFRLRSGGDTFLNATGGNVGIGTPSPGEKLSVATGASEFAVEWSGPGKAWVLGSAAGRAYIRNKTDSVEAISILNAGNVGIGTTAPSSKLSVSDGTVRIDLSPFSGTTGYVGTQSNHPLGIITNNAERMRFDTLGNVGIGLTSLAANTRFHIRDDNGTTNEARAIVQSTDQRITLAARWVSGVEQYSYISSTNAAGVATDFRIRSGSTDYITLASTGQVGIGTTSPASYDAKLTVFNGNFALSTTTNRLYLYYASATNHAFLSTAAGGEITFSNGTASPSEKVRIDTTGQVGIGGAPNTKLDVQSSGQNIITSRSTGSYAAFSRNAPAGQPGYDFCLINGVETARITWSPGDILTFHTGSSAFERLRIDGNGNVGINVANTGSSAKLAVSANSNQLNGAAVSTVLATNAGALGTTAGNELALASIGFTSSNQSMLGIRAWRSSNGGDWTTTSIGLSMDVDATPRAGGGIWLSGNGAVGVGITAPEAAFHVARNAASETSVFVSNATSGGGYAALRLGPPDRSTNFDALVFAGSYMGLRSGNRYMAFETGSGTERMRIHTSGGVSIGDTADPGANTTSISSTLRMLRQNTSSEGGEIQFCRAFDNAVSWYIDLLGAGSGTDPGSMRWVDNRAVTPVSRLELNSRGQLTITNDLGPASTDTQAVGFRGSPNNDLTGAYTLALTDAGRTIRKTDNTARTVTVPADATVNFPLGTCIMLCNTQPSAGLLTITPAAGVSLIRYTTTKQASGTRTVNFGGSATLRKVAADYWSITGTGVG